MGNATTHIRQNVSFYKERGDRLLRRSFAPPRGLGYSDTAQHESIARLIGGLTPSLSHCVGPVLHAPAAGADGRQGPRQGVPAAGRGHLPRAVHGPSPPGCAGDVLFGGAGDSPPI